MEIEFSNQDIGRKTGEILIKWLKFPRPDKWKEDVCFPGQFFRSFLLLLNSTSCFPFGRNPGNPSVFFAFWLVPRYSPLLENNLKLFKFWLNHSANRLYTQGKSLEALEGCMLHPYKKASMKQSVESENNEIMNQAKRRWKII